MKDKLVNLEDRIESVRAAKGKDKLLAVERDGLLVRLAASCPLDDLPPDVLSRQAELASAVERAARQSAATENRRRAISLEEGKEPVRILAGYSVVAIVLLLASVMVLGAGSPIVNDIRDEHKIGKALGLVICGAEITTSDGSFTEQAVSQGSCFAVTSDGYLITNKHVVDDAIRLRRSDRLRKVAEREGCTVEPQVWVFFGHSFKYVAEVAYVSDDHDLAVLKIDATNLPVFRLAGSKEPSRASRVYACGFPGAAQSALSVEEVVENVRRLNLESSIQKQFKLRDFDFVTTTGAVSRVTSEEGGRSWVQHDADIHGGNSGGPLIDDAAVVVGINTLTHGSASGVSFALAMPQLREELNKQVPGLRWK